MVPDSALFLVESVWSIGKVLTISTLMKLTDSYRATRLLKLFILTSLVLLIPVARVHVNSTSHRLCLIFPWRLPSMNNCTSIFKRHWVMCLNG